MFFIVLQAITDTHQQDNVSKIAQLLIILKIQNQCHVYNNAQIIHLLKLSDKYVFQIVNET